MSRQRRWPAGRPVATRPPALADAARYFASGDTFLSSGPIREALADWAPDAVVWDGAGAHSAKLLADLPTARVRLPPDSPELNPAERVFQEIRHRTEGRVYDTVDDKRAVAQAYLARLAADDALDHLGEPAPS